MEKPTACKNCQFCSKPHPAGGYYCLFPKDFWPYEGLWRDKVPSKRPLCMFNTWGKCPHFKEKD